MENNEVIEMRQKNDKEALVEAFREMPIIQVACKRTGISRATYYRWRKEDKNFRKQCEDAMNQGFEYINDLSEAQIINLIKEKKLPAITLWLKNHHPQYGSKTKTYIPIATNEELTPEEQKIIMNALNLVSDNNINYKENEKNHSATLGTNLGE